MAYPDPLERLITGLERLPGIGRRSAERLAFHVLRDPRSTELPGLLERAIEDTRLCAECFNVTEASPCRICSDPERRTELLAVVEQPRDVEAMERAGVYDGRYHVMMGALNPAEGSEAEHLTLAGLRRRVEGGGVQEVILATDPDAEGEATAALVADALTPFVEKGLVVTRMARGLPAGSAIEYLHKGVLQDALEGRRKVH